MRKFFTYKNIETGEIKEHFVTDDEKNKLENDSKFERIFQINLMDEHILQSSEGRNDNLRRYNQIMGKSSW